MKILGLTGGIATGKSTAIAIMQRECPSLVVFDCDQAVGQLFEQGEVLDELVEAFGSEILDREGRLQRGFLREQVFDDAPARTRLEKILHPRVRKECLVKLAQSSKDPSTTLFIADVPLLFESGFDFGQELNLVVATSEATQKIRLKTRSHLADRMISSILKAQLPILEKVARGDVVFWNEGPLSILERQLTRFLNSIPTS